MSNSRFKELINEAQIYFTDHDIARALQAISSRIDAPMIKKWGGGVTSLYDGTKEKIQYTLSVFSGGLVK